MRRPRRAGRRCAPREPAKARVGFAFIALPMALFLLLQIFAIVYAGYISLWDWGLRGPRDFVGHRELRRPLQR